MTVGAASKGRAALAVPSRATVPRLSGGRGIRPASATVAASTPVLAVVALILALIVLSQYNGHHDGPDRSGSDPNQDRSHG